MNAARLCVLGIFVVTVAAGKPHDGFPGLGHRGQTRGGHYPAFGHQQLTAKRSGRSNEPSDLPPEPIADPEPVADPESADPAMTAAAVPEAAPTVAEAAPAVSATAPAPQVPATDRSYPAEYDADPSEAVAAPQSPQAESVAVHKAAVATPCTKAAVLRQANETVAMSTAEKLTAYYEQLRLQQELLAQYQLQQQLYEQQQRRQQEYLMAQQQIQQQYYQQQQHALYMLDQLKKNPVFINQLASFINHEQRVKNEPAHHHHHQQQKPSKQDNKLLAATPPNDGVNKKAHVDGDATDATATVPVDDADVKVVEARQVDQSNYDYDQTPTMEKVYSMISSE